MAKFLIITVDGVDTLYPAENVITTASVTDTSTTITYNHAQAGFDILTLTHADDSAESTKVYQSINNTIELAHSPKGRPDVYFKVPLPVAVSAAAFG